MKTSFLKKKIVGLFALLLLVTGTSAYIASTTNILSFQTSTEATLDNLEVLKGSQNLISGFSSDNLSYTIDGSATSVSVVAVPTSAVATVDIVAGGKTMENPAVVDMTSISSFTVVVKNGSNSKTYTIEKDGPAFEGKRVHFKTSDSWSSYGIYYYDESGTPVKENAAWASMPSMQSEGNGWYTYDMTEDWVGSNTKIIFYGGSNSSRYPAEADGGIAMFTGDEAWFVWDSKTWSSQNPEGPQAPTVSISPNGGKLRGDASIDVNISGDDISSVSATFGSTPIVMTSGLNTIYISEYLNDGDSKTLSVTATNAVGTTPASATFTRDDSVPEVTDVFTWDNALVYFVLTDRFYNGDPNNDTSYSRQKGLAGDVATFHGGDIKGLTAKLDYLEDLGVNAIWLTAPYEQIHGWVSGKDDAFPHYAFHGYYALDWTYMDKSMGTIEEFRTFVDDAHSRGIRIVMDVVVNHTGYNTIEDMITYDFGSTSVTQHGWAESNGGKWNKNHDVTDYESDKWSNWWSGWARGFDGKFGFGTPGGGDLAMSLAGLPDIMTEKTNSVTIPAFLKKKWQMETESSFGPWMLPSAKDLRKDNVGAPADYVIKWLAAWVREFGIDGFRCDTAKHIEKSRWKQLKQEGVAALNEWRNDNAKSSDSPAKDWTDNFWMTGEDFGHGLNLGSSYYSDGGFDSMINFSFNGTSGGSGSTPSTDTWASYANTINSNPNGRNTLSYVSSHDTGLHRPGDMKNLGTMLVLLPGGVQIFYGDETARPKAYTSCGDADMMTRGDMNWDAVDGDVNAHWKKLGKFRKNNPAVGAGKQTDLGNSTYGRKYSKNGYTNSVVIKLNASGATSVNVSGFFADGKEVRDAYTGSTATVSDGSVTFTAGSGKVILIEEVSSGPAPSGPIVTATPASTTFTESVNVTLSVNPATTIYYTTDGSTPTSSSSVYSSALNFTSTTTLKTYAEVNGKSSVRTFTYTKQGPTAPIVTATPANSTFTTSVSVSLTATPAATIYYTTNGTTPSKSSSVYSSALTFTETTTLKTYVEKEGLSDVKTFTYTKGSVPQGKSLETAYYSTNPNGKAGTNKTINMSISNGISSSALSNWTENELIAQSAARDIAQAFNGGHEYPIYDTYSLYAAYDDDYLYLGWQFVDMISGGNNEAKTYNADIRQMLVFDLDPNKSCEGVLTTGETIWDGAGTKLNTFNNGMDAAIMFSSKPTNGTPGIFLPTADGAFSYDPEYCLAFEKNSYGYADGLLPSITSVYGISDYAYDPALLEGSTGFTDLIGTVDKKHHTFYEMKIPLAKLGITKSYIENSGIGVMHVSTYGAGAIGSIPYDPTVYDNVLEAYSQDPSSSAEKDDVDIFTYNMARIGKAEGGGPGPTPVPTAPVVSANPGSKNFTDNVTVSLSVNPATTIYYTTNGTTPSASSSAYSSPLTFTETTTLKTFVEKEGKSDVKTFTYTKSSTPTPIPPTGKTVHFKADGNWSSYGIYYYNDETTKNAEWVSMPSMTAEGNGWYSYNMTEDWVSSNTKVIFYGGNNSNRYPADAAPGVDIFSGDEAWFIWGSKSWSTQNPDGPQKPTVTYSPAGGTVKGGSNITVTISNATSVSGTFGSSSVSLSNGNNNVAVSSYLNDGETKTFTVTATNAEGTTTQTSTFKRDDSTPVVTLSGDFNSLSLYQVMVSSFQDGASVGYGTGYGPSHHNGDLKGIINALDYIKGLGVNALWMTPIFDSTGGSGGAALNSTGYFCTDYFNIDPKFGTKEDFRQLVQKAHEKGLYVILDGVFGHHGGNVKPSPSGKSPSGSNNPVSYPGSLDFYKEVATYWINEFEVDGWRLDQCYQVSYTNQDKNYWKDIREAVEAACNTRKSQGKEWGILGYMVGEDWDGNAATIQGRTYGGDGLRSAFDFPCRYSLVQTIASEESGTGGKGIETLANVFKTPGEKGYSHSKGVYPNMFITNHDVWRFGNLIKQKYSYGKENDAYWKRHKIALATLAGYTGPITIYYGDEIGDLVDCWNGNGSCGANVAGDNMARTNGQISGFNAKQQDLHDWTAEIMKIRNENPAMWRGNNSVTTSNGILANIKYDSETQNKVVVVISNSTANSSITVNHGGSQLVDLVTGATISGNSISVDALSARFFKVQ